MLKLLLYLVLLASLSFLPDVLEELLAKREDALSAMYLLWSLVCWMSARHARLCLSKAELPTIQRLLLARVMATFIRRSSAQKASRTSSSSLSPRRFFFLRPPWLVRTHE